MEESVVSIRIVPSKMEESLMEAAREGDIEALYELIREKPDVLRKKNRKGFVDTPLHLAAIKGHTEFAMELVGLKPSLASKLNQDGLSAIHLALRNGNSDTALSLLKFDKNLVRVKGKNGYTPLHYVVRMKNNRNVLTKFLDECPEYIHDFTNRNETALHVAAKENNLAAIEVLVPWLWRSDFSLVQFNYILNFKNRDGNTVLHIAASKNQTKIVKLLIEYGINFNSKDLTAIGILLQGENQEKKNECLHILQSAQRLKMLFLPWHFFQQINRSAYFFMKKPSENSNDLLVITVLILTATYQAALSPPGGVFQANSQPEGNTTTSTATQILFGSNNTTANQWHLRLSRTPFTAGSSVLNTAPFLWFFIPNIAAFCISFLVTCFVLIRNLSVFFSFSLIVALSMLLFCLLVSAVLIISPNHQSFIIMLRYVYNLAYILFAVMCVTIVKVRVIRRVIKKINK